jgi:hypothetical protein
MQILRVRSTVGWLLWVDLNLGVQQRQLGQEEVPELMETFCPKG